MVPDYRKSAADEPICVRGAVVREELYLKLYPAICFFASRITGDDAVAEDVVQEVFVRFLENGRTFPNLAALKSSLYASVRHRALNHVEKRDNRRRITDTIRAGEQTDNDYFLGEVEADLTQIFAEAVDSLPDRCRRVFTMSYLENRSIREIADQLRISETTVKAHRRRAKALIRQWLPAHGYAEDNDLSRTTMTR